MTYNEVILNKISTIERCVKRIHEVYAGNLANLKFVGGELKPDMNEVDAVLFLKGNGTSRCGDLLGD